MILQSFILDLRLPQEKSHSRVSFDEDKDCWPLLQEAGITVVAAALRHRIPSYGFIITEKSGPGRLKTEKLEEIGIRPGPIYGKLKARQKVCIVRDSVAYIFHHRSRLTLAKCWTLMSISALLFPGEVWPFLETPVIAVSWLNVLRT